MAWTGETLGRGGGSESPLVLDYDGGQQDGQVMRQRCRNRGGVMTHVGLQNLGRWGGGF
jgi:hypothetical protein